jgi:hexosaminidase
MNLQTGMMKGSVVTLVSLLLMHAIAIVVANGTPRNRPYSVLDSPEANRPLYAGFDNMRLSLNGSVLLWPMPAHVTRGKSILALASGFAFGQADGQHISATLAQAFSRYIDIIYEQHSLFQVVSSGLDIPVLEKLLVSLDSSTEELEFEVDESYTLKVPDPSNPNIASLQAATVYGALRGLETFSQLVDYDYSSRSLQIARTPWIIEDYPRFPYRGLLIDTSRHYQPVESIKRVIDSMSFAKLNVLHWHIVDEEAFPIEIPSYPGLWNGAYSYKERYNIEDASEIVEYINI